MKKALLLLVFSAIATSYVIAQDNSSFGIKFSGFVKTDIIWDSRQTVAAREGHFLLYPANEKLDAEGNDINAKATFTMLSIQTRIRGTIKGPDALGATYFPLHVGEYRVYQVDGTRYFSFNDSIESRVLSNAHLK